MGVDGGWMTCLNIAEHIWDVALMINGGVRGSSNGNGFYYPPEVSSMKYCCLGVFRKEYFRLLIKHWK